MAKVLWRTIASCEKMCWSLPPIRRSSRVFLDIDVTIEVTLPFGDSSKVASEVHINWA